MSVYEWRFAIARRQTSGGNCAWVDGPVTYEPGAPGGAPRTVAIEFGAGAGAPEPSLETARSCVRQAVKPDRACGATGGRIGLGRGVVKGGGVVAVYREVKVA